MKIIPLQRPAVCAGCGANLPAGTMARYYSADKIYCESHGDKVIGSCDPGDLRSPGPQADQRRLEPQADYRDMIAQVRELSDRVADLIRAIQGIK